MNAWRMPTWTIERTLRASIVAISATAILVMAIVTFQLARNAGKKAFDEMTALSTVAARARLHDMVQKQVHDFEQIATSWVVATALTDAGGERDTYLTPFLAQKTATSGMRLALYDARGQFVTRTGDDATTGGTAMASEPRGTALPDIDFRVSQDWVVLETPIRRFADNEPIGFLVGSIRPALLAAETSPDIARFYKATIEFYVTTSFVDTPTDLKIVETPRATFAARMTLVAQRYWIEELRSKLALLGLGATLAVLILSIAVARWVAKVISSPVEKLTAAVTKLRNGEQVDPPKVHMPLEIGALSSALFLAFDERSAALQKLENLAHYDSVTGALSRTYFDHRARNLLQVALHRGEPATLLYIDLDCFKTVNDDYGHDAGDHLLQAIIMRARTRLRGQDLIGRRGGDEFVVFLSQMERHADIAALARDLSALITAPVKIDGETYAQVGVSMGAAIFPQDAKKYDALITCADRAMYESKKAGRGRLTFTSGASVELDIMFEHEGTILHP